MSATLTASVTLGSAGIGVLVGQAASGGDSRIALLVGAVIPIVVSVIGGAVALITSRRHPGPDITVRLPEDDHDVPDSTVAFYEAQVLRAQDRELAACAERDAAQREADLWEQRARQSGWHE